MRLTVDRHLPAGRIGRNPIADILKPLPRGTEPRRLSAGRAAHLDGQAIGKEIDGDFRAIVTFIDVTPDDLRVRARKMIFVVRIGRGCLTGAACRAHCNKGCGQERTPEDRKRRGPRLAAGPTSEGTTNI